MALQCPRCHRQYDVTLFQFENVVRCDCGTVLDLRSGHTTQEKGSAEAKPAAAGLAEAPRDTELVLVRHGEADVSLGGPAGDWPLSEVGRRQALDLAERFVLEGAGALYASDAACCRQTAAIIARELALDVQATPQLREAEASRWEGGAGGAPLSAGRESLEELRDHVVAFLREAVRRHAGSRVLMVTHAGPCAVALCHVLGSPLSARPPFRVDHGSVHRVEANVAGWRVVTLNDTSHLRGEGRRP